MTTKKQIALLTTEMIPMLIDCLPVNSGDDMAFTVHRLGIKPALWFPLPYVQPIGVPTKAQIEKDYISGLLTIDGVVKPADVDYFPDATEKRTIDFCAHRLAEDARENGVVMTLQDDGKYQVSDKTGLQSHQILIDDITLTRSPIQDGFFIKVKGFQVGFIKKISSLTIEEAFNYVSKISDVFYYGRFDRFTRGADPHDFKVVISEPQTVLASDALYQYKTYTNGFRKFIAYQEIQIKEGMMRLIDYVPLFLHYRDKLGKTKG